MQAALNTLREERRRVAEACAAVDADDALKATDPGHRHDLLRQMASELVGHDRAIALLEQMAAGPVLVAQDRSEREAVLRRVRWHAGRARRAPGIGVAA